MEELPFTFTKNKSVATIVHKYPPIIITGKDIEELRKAVFEKPKPEEPKFRIQDVSEKKPLYVPTFKPKKTVIQDCPGPNPKSFVPIEVKPRVYKCPEVFTPKPYLPKFKEKRTVIQQV
jgi:hypothetical protein